MKPAIGQRLGAPHNEEHRTRLAQRLPGLDDDLGPDARRVAQGQRERGQGRAAAWRVAWDAARSRPVVGIGAGGFEQRWLAARRQPFAFRDAHNLYLEMLAELGAVGLALLLAAFAVLAVTVGDVIDVSAGLSCCSSAP